MNRVNKKLLCSLLSLVLLSTTCPLAVFDELGASSNEEAPKCAEQGRNALGAVPASITDGYEVYFNAESDALIGTYNTLAEACTAVNNDGSGTDYTVLATADDAAMGAEATINTNKTVMLTSAAGHVITQASSGARHIVVNGGLVLENITLDGNGGGGGVVVSNGTLTMNDGAVITKCSSSGSGSGVYLRNSSFTMDGGEISDNHQSTPFGASGGGVHLLDSGFIMHSGIITRNSAVWGGGVEVNQESTFTMHGGEISHNSATVEYGGGVNISAHGVFEMNGGTITHNRARIGGGIFVGQGSYVDTDPHDWCKLVINDGFIEHNEAATSGGGVAARWNGLIEMNGGAISNNTALAGGGVFLTRPREGAGSVSFTMRGGEIYGNTATGNAPASGGGGIYAYDEGVSAPNTISVVIGDNTGASAGAPLIYGNLAGTKPAGAGGYGGGIFLRGANVLTAVCDAEIYENTALCGGGAYVFSDTSLKAEGTVSFTNNHAANEGGAIYTQQYTGYNGNIPGDYSAVRAGDYGNIISGADTIFTDNTASAAYDPPDNADTVFSNIGYAASSIFKSGRYMNPLNNYDINYVKVTEITFTVNYDANGGTGSYSDTDLADGSMYTVLGLSDTNISRGGYMFTGWNTEAGGGGTSYAEGDTLIVRGNVTLYAQWETESGGENPPPPDIKTEHFAYIIGYPDGRVGPENNITRAEAVTIFFRLITKETREAMWSKINSFTDVMPEKWYNNAISTLANGGILEGYPNGSFLPENSITRAEFTAIAAKLRAENMLKTSNRLGYMPRHEDGTFSPDNPITRAEAMAFLNGFLNRHVEAKEDMTDEMVTWPDNIETDKWYYLIVQEAANSHTYVRKNDGVNEIWIGLLDVPDWAALEHAGAKPGDIDY